MTLKELRTSKKLSQKDVASALGTTQVSISRYETGAREIPTKVAKLIAGYFDVPWYSLYEDSMKEPQ